ncbi:MAG: hypothetical protein KGY48_02080 [Wenzhouxiangellaceae bacterium]|jgi:predicted Ser/Thr protein kinase|nr:hypothetical protein [Wenzhouxiangellaceae bacterium]MBS3747420.1 hypothetical protein [Wenzhouxiangellaceae bacterium]MBS3823887.1 hypothetical protein [Wenzhouxiangellaceae bacterium]
MTSPSDAITRTVTPEALAEAVVLARSNQGVVYRLDAGGRQLAVKAAAGRGPLRAVNRHALRREYQAYQRLAGLAGMPKCHGLIENRWLVLDFVPGEPFRRARPVPEFFDDLLETIRAMHARGVAHGDLKRKSNLVVDVSGRPVLLDFGAATLHRPGRHPVNHRLFEFMRRTDLNAWVKLKYGGYSGVSEADRALLQRSWLERMLSRVRG